MSTKHLALTIIVAVPAMALGVSVALWLADLGRGFMLFGVLVAYLLAEALIRLGSGTRSEAVKLNPELATSVQRSARILAVVGTAVIGIVALWWFGAAA